MGGSAKPYFTMLLTAPLVWFLSLLLGNDGYEGFLVIASIIYGIIGAIFGYFWPRHAWQWGLLLSVPNWLFSITIRSTLVEIIQDQPVIGVLLILHPLIGGTFGAYVVIAIQAYENRPS